MASRRMYKEEILLVSVPNADFTLDIEAPSLAGGSLKESAGSPAGSVAQASANTCRPYDGIFCGCDTQSLPNKRL